MATDIATRVYNHAFRIDPAIRTLLDTDFYKLLMLQMIWKMHPKRQVTFQLINRTTSVSSRSSTMSASLTDVVRLMSWKVTWRFGCIFQIIWSIKSL